MHHVLYYSKAGRNTLRHVSLSLVTVIVGVGWRWGNCHYFLSCQHHNQGDHQQFRQVVSWHINLGTVPEHENHWNFNTANLMTTISIKRGYKLNNQTQVYNATYPIFISSDNSKAFINIWWLEHFFSELEAKLLTLRSECFC